MGTRSRIGILEPDGSVTSIYTHWDGYPSHHGPILRDNYATEENVRALIALGDLSVLGEDVGEKHDFDHAPEGTCTAYGRDRGETDVGCRKSASVKEFLGIAEAYNYLFDPSTKKWSMVGESPSVKMTDIDAAIAGEEEE